MADILDMRSRAKAPQPDVAAAAPKFSLTAEEFVAATTPKFFLTAEEFPALEAERGKGLITAGLAVLRDSASPNTAIAFLESTLLAITPGMTSHQRHLIASSIEGIADTLENHVGAMTNGAAADFLRSCAQFTREGNALGKDDRPPEVDGVSG